MGNDVYRASIFIEAPPEVVFTFFTQPEALTSWMGDAALIEPRPGGRFVLHFEGRVVEGRYLAVDPPRRVVITWGRRGSRGMPPGSSTLEVTLSPEADGTRVAISHDGLPPSERERHALGWRHYLPRLLAASEGRPPAAHHVPEELTRGAD